MKKIDITLEEPELTLEFKEELDILPETNVETEPEIETQMEIEDEEIYSKEKVAGEIGLDLDSFNELFKDFAQEARTILTKIEDAIVTNDYAASKRQAIKLKGMSDNMRMHAFTNELEVLIQSKDKDAITQALKNIDNVLAKISKEED